MINVRKLLIENGLIATYWGHIIARADEEGTGFSLGEMQSAGDWVTCACGRLEDEDGILREEDGSPIDADLRNLGFDFNDYIGSDQVVDACLTLIKIQHKAVELIQEHHNSLGNT